MGFFKNFILAILGIALGLYLISLSDTIFPVVIHTGMMILIMAFFMVTATITYYYLPKTSSIIIQLLRYLAFIIAVAALTFIFIMGTLFIQDSRVEILLAAFLMVAAIMTYYYLPRTNWVMIKLWRYFAFIIAVAALTFVLIMGTLYILFSFFLGG